MQPPKVQAISRTPLFKALRAKVDAAQTVAEKLAVVQAAQGFYRPGFDMSNPEVRARSVLISLILSDALENAGATWADSDHDTRPPGEIAAQVLTAALGGAVDPETVSPSRGAAMVAAMLAGGPAVALALGLKSKTGAVLRGATIADAVRTDMNLSQALAMLRTVDPAAAAMVAQGAAAAGGAHSADYGERLRANFVNRATTWANPFTNPVWGGFAKMAGLLALGAVVAVKVFEPRGRR